MGAFSSGSPGRRLCAILRFAHTGEGLGLPGQTIAGIASAGAVVLVYSGLALSLRRFLTWRRRRETLRKRPPPSTRQKDEGRGWHHATRACRLRRPKPEARSPKPEARGPRPS